MSVLWRESKASLAFVERNYYLFKRYLGWEIVFLAYGVVNALTIGLIGASQSEEQILYLVIGALFWNFLGVLFHQISETVSWERWEGTIEYTFMAPVHRLTHLGGMCLFGIIYGIIRTVVILMALTLFLDFDFTGANLAAGMVVLTVASLAFIGLGLMAAILPLISPERGAQMTNIIQAVILLVSGVYYEIEVLPVWLQPLSRLSPGTYALRAARGALLEGMGLGELRGELMIILLIGALLIPLGYLFFRLAENYAMKNGKLKRSG